MSEPSSAIPQTDPGAFWRRHAAEARACFERVLSAGRFILGPEVAAFEAEFAATFGYRTAVGVASGTDALILALRSLGVRRGDRVATVSHTAVATVAAIELAGAEPVLVDVDLATYTMDPSSLAAALTDIGGIRAVIVVHLYGHPADMAALGALAQAHGVGVVEDCAQAHGARRNGRFVGTFGQAASFSFYPTKNLGALGDGGLVASRDPALAERLRADRQYGWDADRISALPGMNSRLDEMQAAYLRLALRHLAAGNARRHAIAEIYRGGLAAEDLVLPREAPGAACVYHQYVVRHPRRDALREALRRRGVGTSIHYPVPVHLQPAYAGRLRLAPGGLPATEAIAASALSLPMYPELDDAEVERVVEAVNSAL